MENKKIIKIPEKLDDRLKSTLEKIGAKGGENFSDYRNYFVLLNEMKKIETKKIVMKPLEKSGGEGIIIGEKEDVLKLMGENNFDRKPYVVQEFVNTSKGIPRIMKGIHDLRLVFISNELIYAYYRQPAKGKLLANLAQGGRMVIVPLKDLPKEIDPIVDFTHDIFSPFRSNIFTVDLMFDEKARPWIAELNSMPGMYFESGQEKTRKYFYQKLLEVIKNEYIIQR